jgi:hypothetical protein
MTNLQVAIERRVHRVKRHPQLLRDLPDTQPGDTLACSARERIFDFALLARRIVSCCRHQIL